MRISQLLFLYQFFIWPNFWLMGIVDISIKGCYWQMGHTHHSFDFPFWYPSRNTQTFSSVESKTIVRLLIWTQLWFLVLFW